MKAEDYNERSIEPWEKKFGRTVQERTQNLGSDAHQFRESVNLAPIGKEARIRHETYIHHLGSDVLKTLFTDEQIHEREREIALKKQSKIGQLLRKRVKITDFEDGGLNVSMEQVLTLL